MLARCKNSYHADRRSCLALRKSGDDVKPITLDSVVSDPRYLAQIDALALNRTQAISPGGGRQRGDTECSGEKACCGLT